MLRHALAAALFLLLAACTSPATASASCRDGEGEFFIRVSRTAGFGPPEWHDREYRESLDRDGSLFAYYGTETPGSGVVTFDPDGPVNLDAAQVRLELERLGAYRTDRDYRVHSAWRAAAPADDFGRLCRIVHEEWVTSQGDSDQVVSCDDGGTVTFDVSTARGKATKVWRCDGSGVPQDEWESVSRINTAYQELANAAMDAAGL